MPCTPTRCRPRTPTPGSPPAHRSRRCAVPGVVRVLTAADVPGVNDAGVKHDEPLFPSEVMYHGPRRVLGARRVAGGGPAGRRWPSRSTTSRCPSLVTIAEAIAAESFQGARPTLRRGDPEAAWAGCAHVFEGEFEFAGQEHFYLETNAALATIDENGQVFVQSQHAAPERDPGDHRARAGPDELRGHGAVPADGRRLRRQGDAAARLRGDRRARRPLDRPAGAAAAEPHAGHDDDRQAARVPRPRGRSASTPTAGSRR